MVLVALNVGVEIVLLGADWGLWGGPLWRPLSYQFGGFWAGLLRDWQPNFAAQPATMFLTYSLLHAGTGHMLGNMASLAMLGPLVVAQVGERGLVVLYALSVLAGAAVFGWMSTSAAPMVGASGAAFGLAGALVVWDFLARRQVGRAATLVLAIVVLNAVLWWIAGGNLAWQTHLGGFVMGAAVAVFTGNRKRAGGADQDP